VLGSALTLTLTLSLWERVRVRVREKALRQNYRGRMFADMARSRSSAFLALSR